jgi:hypothetical protein
MTFAMVFESCAAAAACEHYIVFNPKAKRKETNLRSEKYKIFHHLSFNSFPFLLVH